MKTLLIILALILTGIQSFASEKYYGVDDHGQALDTKNYYIVHGGCRTDNIEDKLTEIWLHISEEPNTRYNPGNSRMKNGTMYLNQKYGTIESFIICSFFRNALEKQIPVKMEILQDRRWNNFFIVKSLEMSQIRDNNHLVTIDKLLENFSVRAE